MTAKVAAVRVIFNGKTLQLGGPCASTTTDNAEAAAAAAKKQQQQLGQAAPVGTCPWTEWQELLAPLIPTAHQCPEFYTHWAPP